MKYHPGGSTTFKLQPLYLSYFLNTLQQLPPPPSLPFLAANLALIFAATASCPSLPFPSPSASSPFSPGSSAQPRSPGGWISAAGAVVSGSSSAAMVLPD
ncbi:hypothetical protein HPP92_010329 [Vanilla planifolia]|uniref:Uncharacterized protein n=1 Tax=Vanilla planifolia TaxID=51239 RepID=A0A835V1B7_VANPL|nr:hypothetical protein HPP92_010329 [Vanilla planifolia]